MNLRQVLHDAAAMTLSSTVEATLRGRGSSTTPATAVANTLGVEPKSDNHEQRLNNIAHWGYGTSLGMLRGLLAVAGLSGPAAAGAHLGSVYAMEQIVLPATGASPPAWTWGAKELATLSDRPDRGLRVALGLPVRRTGRLRRVGGLAVLSPVRQPRGVRPAAR